MSARITHLDTARGVAVMGILVMNSVSFGLGDQAYFDLTVGSGTTADWIAGVFGEVFVDQKFMGLFSLLFGASLLLFLDRVGDRTSRPAALSLWRNALLFGIGVLHSALWSGDILMVYGLCAGPLLLVRRASARVLLALGVGVFAVSTGLDWAVAAYADDAAIRGAWRALGTTTTEPTWVLVLIILQVFSRALGMMLLGMGLYRGGWLIDPPAAWGLRPSIIAIAVGAIVAGLGVGWTAAGGFSATAVMQGNVVNGVATLPLTLGYLGVLVWWDRQGGGRWLHRARCMGRTALTNYLGQTVIGVGLMLLIPQGWVSRWTLWLVIPVVWWAQLMISAWWLERFRMGPVEWSWRCATYRRWSPLRR